MISKPQLPKLMTQGSDRKRCGPLFTQNVEEVDGYWMPVGRRIRGPEGFGQCPDGAGHVKRV